jgi:hypothetical protein
VLSTVARNPERLALIARANRKATDSYRAATYIDTLRNILRHLPPQRPGKTKLRIG